VLDQDVKHQSPSIIGDASISAKDPALMSVDELWTFYQKVGEILAEKITSELQHLQRRLALLKPEVSPEANRGAFKCRAGSTVPPKYRNPEQPSETWVGRGRQPRWLKAQLGLGKRLEDLMIR
jgi:DNA-binding protein H-NS